MCVIKVDSTFFILLGCLIYITWFIASAIGFNKGFLRGRANIIGNKLIRFKASPIKNDCKDQ